MTAQVASPVARVRRRFPSWFVRFLCLALAPVLVVTVPGVASAAQYGPGGAADGSFEVGASVEGPYGTSSGDGFSCSVSGVTAADIGIGPGSPPDRQWIEYSMACDTGYGVTGLYGVLQASCGGVTFRNGVVIAGDGAGDGMSGSMFAIAGLAEGCAITEGCLTYTLNTWQGASFNAVECFAWPLGEFPLVAVEPPDGCALFTPTGVPSVNYRWSPGNEPNWMEISISIPLTFAETPPNMEGYRVTTAFRIKGDPALYFGHADGTGGGGKIRARGDVTPLVIGVRTWSQTLDYVEIVGVQIMPEWINYQDDNQNWPGSTRWDEGLPQTTPSGDMGTTNPPACFYYFGDKIAEDTSSTRDDPAGPLNAAAVPPPMDPPVLTPTVPGDQGGCGFSLTDPSSWASAGICALVELIGQMVRVLGNIFGVLGDLVALVLGLVADLLAGLGDLLGSLFVPSPGYMDTAVQDVTTSVEATNVGEWKDTVDTAWGTAGGVATAPVGARAGLSAGGGCEGPSITWDKFADANLPTTIHPFKACTGMAATAADWSRLILTFVVGFGGLMKIAQMLMASMGFVRQTDIMLGHDWGSDRFS